MSRSSFRFGDLIENGWASLDNPTRRGFFVRSGTRKGKMNAGPYVVVTDGKGKFWEVCADKEAKLSRVSSATALDGREGASDRQLDAAYANGASAVLTRLYAAGARTDDHKDAWEDCEAIVRERRERIHKKTRRREAPG